MAPVNILVVLFGRVIIIKTNLASFSLYIMFCFKLTKINNEGLYRMNKQFLRPPNMKFNESKVVSLVGRCL